MATRSQHFDLGSREHEIMPRLPVYLWETELVTQHAAPHVEKDMTAEAIYTEFNDELDASLALLTNTASLFLSLYP